MAECIKCNIIITTLSRCADAQAGCVKSRMAMRVNSPFTINNNNNDIHGNSTDRRQLQNRSWDRAVRNNIIIVFKRC